MFTYVLINIRQVHKQITWWQTCSWFSMSRDGDPPFPLLTDGGIWQVSLYGFLDTMNTEKSSSFNYKIWKDSSKFWGWLEESWT